MQHIVTNSVDTDQVAERTINGDRHLIAQDVTFIRPQQLAGGYVPRTHVEASANAWADQPLGVNHPRDDHGRVVSYNSPIGEETVVGHARDPTANPDGSVSADLAVNADRAEELGGEAMDVVDALENGEPLEVSSQYFADALAPGIYDGQYREEVEGNLDPDGIALLPNKQGACSLPDCGFDPSGVTANADGLRVPVANADQADDPHGEDLGDTGTDTANAVNYALTGVSPDDVDDWTDDEWDGSDAVSGLPNPSEDDDAAAVLDATHAVHPTDEATRDAKSNWKLPFRTSPDAPVNTRALVAIDAALSGGRGGVEGLGQNVADDVSEWVGGMLEAAPDDLFGSTNEGEPSANTLLDLGRRVASTLGLTASHGNEPAESGVDYPGQEGGYGFIRPSAGRGSDSATEAGEDDMTNRDELIDAITSNSEIERESLEAMGDTCLEATHDHVVANDDGGEEEQEQESNTGEDTLADMTVDDLADGLAERGFVTEGDLGEAVANAQEQSEKEQRVERIIANSAEYDEDDAETLLDTPEPVLEDIEAGLSSNATLPGATGAAERATANAGGGDDLDEYTDGMVGGDL
jgi:hypothetical protein